MHNTYVYGYTYMYLDIKMIALVWGLLSQYAVYFMPKFWRNSLQQVLLDYILVNAPKLQSA